MKIRPFPLEAGHPANHGYERCLRCGTQRLKADLIDREWTWHHDVHGPINMDGPRCIDEAGCTRWRAEAEARFQPKPTLIEPGKYDTEGKRHG